MKILIEIEYSSIGLTLPEELIRAWLELWQELQATLLRLHSDDVFEMRVIRIE